MRTRIFFAFDSCAVFESPPMNSAHEIQSEEVRWPSPIAAPTLVAESSVHVMSGKSRRA